MATEKKSKTDVKYWSRLEMWEALSQLLTIAAQYEINPDELRDRDEDFLLLSGFMSFYGKSKGAWLRKRRHEWAISHAVVELAEVYGKFRKDKTSTDRQHKDIQIFLEKEFIPLFGNVAVPALIQKLTVKASDYKVGSKSNLHGGPIELAMNKIGKIVDGVGRSTVAALRKRQKDWLSGGKRQFELIAALRGETDLLTIRRIFDVSEPTAIKIRGLIQSSGSLVPDEELDLQMYGTEKWSGSKWVSTEK